MNPRPGPDPLPDDTAGIVRLYALTDGRTRPRHQLSMDTVLGPGPRAPQGLSEESARITELCQERTRPLVELAGMLGLHVTAVRILVSDLIDASALRLPVSDTPGEDRDAQLLRAAVAGLKRNWAHAVAKAG
ncbi:DUF742 domain-containing protein [Streptomyces pseudovenezuelae]|uniref:DUF742 domain-containing protein n=1 Tax=Streptomyces pseudovenezuelae TaxID=67350 RepID=A0ABT6LYW4_9ACTN|nr:DUF742 domain-containing protein [Streptomyces pseudovenezuelae]MDH6221492.1 hypothetical protein [Streptomyces pseudovenezuelae]